MIKRKAEAAVRRLASQFPVVAITGPRQSGKTTLAKTVYPKKEYISFDDKTMRELASSNPKDFLDAFPDGVILDEVQKVPGIFDAVKMIVDSGKYSPGKFILTGSSQFRLKENISDSLAGRAGYIKLLPFSLGELKDEGMLLDSPYDYVCNGFYPPLYDTGKHFIREDWIENYIDTYLDLDVKDQINPSNVRAFGKMVRLCAAYSSQLVGYERLARDVGVSAVTIKQWLSILEASYIIHFLQPAENNLGKKMIKTPKMYFIDPGLMCHLLGINSKEELLLSSYKGSAVETMAVSELLKAEYNTAKKSAISFYRDDNKLEIDVVAEWNTATAIEIKSSSSAEKSLSKNVRKYIEMRPDDPVGMVFYLGDISCNINGINYVSWKDWSKTFSYI